MDLRPITNKLQYNKLVTHIIQSWEWGEARVKLGLPLLRYGIYKKGKLACVFQLTLHKIPFTNKYVGYLPKGPLPDEDIVQALKEIGKKNNCAFIKLEPNIEVTSNKQGLQPNGLKAQVTSYLIKSPKPLFTKYNFIIDLTKSEDQLLKDMHPKTRYNIKVAQKHGVKVTQTTDNQAFEDYLKLYFETTKRQNYHGHDKNYHKTIWETLKKDNLATLLIATYQGKPLTTWMLLIFKDTLYYPYGGSSIEHREAMANNLVAWEAIKLGKKLQLKYFDMWGALGPNPNPKDPWFGFHKFKMGYGGKLVEYTGTYDLVINWPIYIIFTAIDKLMPLKVFLLKLLKNK